MKHYSDDHLDIHIGDCRDVLATLPAESVHCVVTSPPYWGLRDYGTASWAGGDADCDHEAGPSLAVKDVRRQERQEVRDDDAGVFAIPSGWSGRDVSEHPASTCGKCGAVREDKSLGLEPTPEAFIASMVEVFREVRRVLRRDGTLWLNMGDSYSNPPPSGTAGQWNADKHGEGHAKEAIVGQRLIGGLTAASGLPAKNLVGMPWRLAFALQADGWYLRSDIIWAKPNPMPESVTDRPTKAHEYVFLLTKSARYYYDAEAVREQNVTQGDDGTRDDGTQQAFVTINPAGRNLRSVWQIATEPYPGAHFATFPQKLVEPCIKAGSPAGGVVLDPFAGSGTTGLVANRLGRRAILIDLSADYIDQAMLRNQQHPLGLIG